MNPYDLDERLREVDEAEVRHESEESARRALSDDPETANQEEAPDREQPADD